MLTAEVNGRYFTSVVARKSRELVSVITRNPAPASIKKRHRYNMPDLNLKAKHIVVIG